MGGVFHDLRRAYRAGARLYAERRAVSGGAGGAGVVGSRGGFGPPAQDYPFPRYGVSSAADFDAYIRVYQKSPWVRMAIDRIASSIERIPLEVVGREDGPNPGKKYPNHLVARLLRQANPWDQQASLVRSLISYYELAGNAFLVLERDDAGVPREMFVLNPAKMTPVVDPRVRVSKWVYDNNDHQTEFDPSDVIHWRTWTGGLSDIWGLPPVATLTSAVVLDQNAQDAARAWYRNWGLPSGVIRPKDEDGLSDRELSRLKSELEAQTRGPSRFGSMVAIPYSVDISQIDTTPKDAQFLDQRRFSREEIGGLYGVPPIYLSDFSAASYANSEAQSQAFAQNVILPTLQSLLDILNERLVMLIDPTVRLVADESVIGALVETRKESTERVKVWLTNGIVTTNEAREMAGLPHSDAPGADDLLKPINFAPMGASTAPTSTPPPDAGAQEETPAAEDEPEGQIDQSSTRPDASPPQRRGRHSASKRRRPRGFDWRSLLVKALDEELEEGAKPMEKAVVRFQADLVKRTVGRQRSIGRLKPDDMGWDADEMGLALAEILRPLKREVMRRRALRTLGRMSRSIATYGRKQETLEGALAGADPSDWSGIIDTMMETNPALLESLGSSLEKSTSSVVQANAERISSILAQAMADPSASFGSTMDSLTSMAGAPVAAFQARAIALTESNAGAQTITQESFKEAGVETKTWQVISLSRTDPRDGSLNWGKSAAPDHDSLNDMTIPVTDVFPNGLSHPCDPAGGAAEVVNCKCAIIPGDPEFRADFIRSIREEVATKEIASPSSNGHHPIGAEA